MLGSGSLEIKFLLINFIHEKIFIQEVASNFPKIILKKSFQVKIYNKRCIKNNLTSLEKYMLSREVKILCLYVFLTHPHCHPSFVLWKDFYRFITFSLQECCWMCCFSFYVLPCIVFILSLNFSLCYIHISNFILPIIILIF